MEIVLYGLVIIIAIYFAMTVHMERKRKKAFVSIQSHVKKGDNVIVLGGLHGTVTKVEKDTLIINISQGIDITVDRIAINDILKKSESEISLQRQE